MLTSALVATGHGYSTPDRCDAFDPFEIIANPLGGHDDASRESRVFDRKDGSPGVTYGSHALYLMRRKDRRAGDRELYVAVHNGAGRQIWQIPACFNYCDETAAALVAMPERALYSLLRGIVEALDDTRRAAVEVTATEWREAAAHKRIRRRAYPSRGTVKIWIEPARMEGESEQQFELRKIMAAPSRA